MLWLKATRQSVLHLSLGNHLCVTHLRPCSEDQQFMSCCTKVVSVWRYCWSYSCFCSLATRGRWWCVTSIAFFGVLYYSEGSVCTLQSLNVDRVKKVPLQGVSGKRWSGMARGQSSWSISRSRWIPKKWWGSGRLMCAPNRGILRRKSGGMRHITTASCCGSMQTHF